MARRLREGVGLGTLGPPAAWPAALKTLAGMMLDSRQPMFIAWGGQLSWLYNDAFIPFLGLAHPAVLGGRVLDARADWAPSFERLLAGEAVTVLDTGSAFAHREPTRCAFACTPVRDESGAICGVLGLCTEPAGAPSQAIERALAETRERSAQQQRLYEAILTNTPDLAYVFDLQHRFIYANEGLLKMWGRTAQDAIGKTCLELGYEPWHAKMHDREIDYVVATGQPIRGEVPFNGSFGRRIYDYIFVPVLNARGDVEAVAGTTRDVTDHRENVRKLHELAGELEETSRRKTEFLAMLAHELRNPLAPISGAMHNLQQAAENPQVVRASAGIVQRQLRHMVRLVNDLMDVSRITSGNIDLQREALALDVVITHAVETCRPVIEQAGQVLEIEAGGGALVIDADRVRLSQIICNLLNNASKYSDPGSTIRLAADLADGQARIVVRDEGVGIPPDRLDDIFEMFTQIDLSLERSRSGLGVGLALVRTLVELHGGSVRAYSAGPGQGSTFTVLLPLAIA